MAGSVKTITERAIEILVEKELAKATEKHSPMASSHEAYAVVKEEFDEWWETIMANNRDPHHKLNGARELIQMAAMCHRALFDVYTNEVTTLARQKGII